MPPNLYNPLITLADNIIINAFVCINKCFENTFSESKNAAAKKTKYLYTKVNKINKMF